MDQVMHDQTALGMHSHYVMVHFWRLERLWNGFTVFCSCSCIRMPFISGCGRDFTRFQTRLSIVGKNDMSSKQQIRRFILLAHIIMKSHFISVM